MRLATWNVNSAKVRLPRLLDWLDQRRPDVVTLQETKLPDAEFDAVFGAELAARGYAYAHAGDGRWNGVAILSRVGLDDVAVSFPGQPGFPDPAGPPEIRAIAASCAGIRVWSLYVPNGRTPDDPHFAYKLAWLKALATVLPAVDVANTVLTGDMNIAPTDADVWDITKFGDSTHVTPEERAALAELVGTGLTDVLRAPLAGRAGLHLLGLPGRRLPPGPRHADRPGAGRRGGGRPGAGGVGGPAGPQGQRAERPRAGDGRPGRGAGRRHRAGGAAAVVAGRDAQARPRRHPTAAPVAWSPCAGCSPPGGWPGTR